MRKSRKVVPITRRECKNARSHMEVPVKEEIRLLTCRQTSASMTFHLGPPLLLRHAASNPPHAQPGKNLEMSTVFDDTSHDCRPGASGCLLAHGETYAVMNGGIFPGVTMANKLDLEELDAADHAMEFAPAHCPMTSPTTSRKKLSTSESASSSTIRMPMPSPTWPIPTSSTLTDPSAQQHREHHTLLNRPTRTHEPRQTPRGGDQRLLETHLPACYPRHACSVPTAATSE